ncbi:Membrane coat complex Retromer, subunit VPS5/SNX1, Sorting nexins, and related PX domain-containing proteins [Phaffia rhodozyma]|uniref:Sorting nexin MVP1 n=1 Tax=Phaffia rhodozyma TaxID=264483 RepID=A0A0F7SGE5_PHARH|nr:Membrane coat complex Retromer, subunit VPS5/SNX1, Sorting nexins, and related PX domain-containing proteins [Phaffia rhodozyma]
MNQRCTVVDFGCSVNFLSRFNAPRQRPSSSLVLPSPGQSPSNGPLYQTWNPLAFHSDPEPSPWSTAPSPSEPPFLPSNHLTSSSDGYPTSFQPSGEPAEGELVDEARLGREYFDALDWIDPEGKGREGVTVTGLIRVLREAGLRGADVEKITDLISTNKSRISKQEFFLALVLVGLVQAKEPLSLSNAKSRRSNPPTLSLSLSPPTPKPTSSISNPVDRPAPEEYPTPAPSSLDPWSSMPIPTTIDSPSSLGPTYPSSFLSTPSVRGQNPLQRKGLLAIPDWFDKLKQVDVRLATEKEGRGFFWKWNVFELSFDGIVVRRRYSDFLWLEECLIKKYPFRMHFNLPPKRIGADSIFLEQRRKALSRYINFVVNHPTVGSDWLVGVFMREPKLDTWRKKTQVNVDEESKGRKLTEREEIEIPHDLEEKLRITRRHLPAKIQSWSTLTTLYDRQARRAEALASDLSRFSSALASASEAAGVSWKTGESATPVGEEHSQRWSVEPGEVDLLGEGVATGLAKGRDAWGLLAGRADVRSREMSVTTLEALKNQRDLFVSFRELFNRIDQLSQDPVPKLRKRIEQTKGKMTQTEQARKPGFEAEIDRLRGIIESDESAIEGHNARQGVIRYIMWYELAFLMYPREHALATKAFQQLATHEVAHARDILGIWEQLESELENMPLE